MIRGVNDDESNAHELGRLLRPRRGDVMVNLIPFNPTDATPDCKRPPAQHALSLRLELRATSEAPQGAARRREAPRCPLL